MAIREQRAFPLLNHGLHRRARSSRSDGDFGSEGEEFGHRRRPPEREQPTSRCSLPTLLPGPGAERQRGQKPRDQAQTSSDHRNLYQPPDIEHQQNQAHFQLIDADQQQQQLDGRISATMAGKLTRRELRDMKRQRIAATRFRKFTRLIIIMVSWIRVLLKRKDYTEDESVRIVDTLKGFSTADSDLSFDLSYFRAKREIDLTGEMKAILQLEPHSRTPEQVQTVMYGLQNLPTFNEYPLRTQEKLARVAFYQAVPGGRLIIRQGHIGINFYIIIRGRVIVSVMKEDRRTGETKTNIVARLGQGQSFGEVALLHQVARTASVVSQEPAQLLVIGREEFDEIFTKAEPGRLPGHVEFLVSCGFMRRFPLHRLLEQPSACQLTFFRRDALIAPDSKTHSHLVIVRSGSCRVVKNLRVPDKAAGDAECILDEEALRRQPRLTNDKAEAFVEPRVDTWRRRPKAFAASLTIGQQLQKQKQQETQQLLQLQLIDGTKRDGSLEATTVEVTRPRQQQEGRSDERPETDGKSTTATTVAVQVSTLKPGDVFGLSDVVFKGESNAEVEASASVALVSNGAECVLLSKAFFVHNATEQVRRDVREMARPYPEESVFAENYRCQVAWDRYRRQLFRETLRLIATRSK